MKMRRCAEKRPLMGQYKVIILNARSGHYFITGTARHWLDIGEQDECTLTPRKHTTGLKWPWLYMKPCSSASSADDTERQKSAKGGWNCTHPVHLWSLWLKTDISGPLKKTNQRNMLTIVKTDRYKKESLAISVRRTTALHVAVEVLYRWMLLHNTPITTKADSSAQIMPMLFAALCASMGTKLLTATECHPPESGQLERFSKTLVARLRLNTDKFRADWNIYVQPATFAYVELAQRTTKTSIFSFVLDRKPPRLI